MSYKKKYRALSIEDVFYLNLYSIFKISIRSLYIFL